MATRTPRPKKRTRQAGASNSTSSIKEKPSPPLSSGLAAKIGDVLERLIRPAADPAPKKPETAKSDKAKQGDSVRQRSPDAIAVPPTKRRALPAAPATDAPSQRISPKVAAPTDRPHPNPLRGGEGADP